MAGCPLPRSPYLASQIDKCCQRVLDKLDDFSDNEKEQDSVSEILLDSASRSAYRTANESQGPIDRINVKTEGKVPLDLRQRSNVVASIGDFKLARAYFPQDSQDAEKKITRVIDEEVKNAKN